MCSGTHQLKSEHTWNTTRSISIASVNNILHQKAGIAVIQIKVMWLSYVDFPINHVKEYNKKASIAAEKTKQELERA